MDFEDTISAIGELAGSEVVVRVSGADENPPVVFVWTGELRVAIADDFGGWIHGAAWGRDADVRYFGLDDSHGRGFYLSSRDFRGARFEPLDGHEALAVDLGNVTVRIHTN